MLKVISALFFTAVCVVIGLLPEIAMYLSWQLVQPTDELYRVVLLFLFWVVGSGPCVTFALFSFVLWLAFISACC